MNTRRGVTPYLTPRANNRRARRCQQCSGVGALDAERLHECPTCRGRGTVMLTDAEYALVVGPERAQAEEAGGECALSSEQREMQAQVQQLLSDDPHLADALQMRGRFVGAVRARLMRTGAITQAQRDAVVDIWQRRNKPIPPLGAQTITGVVVRIAPTKLRGQMQVTVRDTTPNHSPGSGVILVSQIPKTITTLEDLVGCEVSIRATVLKASPGWSTFEDGAVTIINNRGDNDGSNDASAS